MVRFDQNVFVKLGLVLASVALVMSFAATEEFLAYEVYDDVTSPIGIEVEVIEGSYPRISSEDGDAFPPEPSLGAYNRLKNCAGKISSDYADEIYNGIFKGEPLGSDGCKALLRLQYDCHI